MTERPEAPAPLRILIVAGSEDDARLIVAELERGGYAPAWRRVSDAEAMRAALVAEAWHLVLAGDASAGFGATDALAVLQTHGPHLPLIVITSKADEETVVGAMRRGAADVVHNRRLQRLVPAVARAVRDPGQHRERRQADAGFRNLVERSLQGIVVHDRGKPVFANQAMADILGYASPDELLALGTVEDVLPPDEAERVRAIRVRREQGEKLSSRYDVQALRKDGTPIWLHTLVSPIEWQGRRCTQLCALDVTAAREAAEQVAVSKRLLQTVIDTMPSGVVLRGADGEKLLVNEARSRMGGLTPAEWMAGPDPCPLLAPECADDAMEAFRTVVATGEPLSREEWWTLRDGRREYHQTHRLPVRDEAGNVTAVLLVSVNLTERRLAEEEVLAAQSRLHDAVEALPGAFFQYDADGRLVAWNSRVADIHSDLSSRLRVGMPMTELVQAAAALLQADPREAAASARGWSRIVRDGMANAEERLPDGRWLQVIVRRTSDDGRILLALDVTEHKAAEAALFASKQMLETVLDAVPSRIVVRDAEDRRLLVNKAHAATRGVSPAQFMALPEPYPHLPPEAWTQARRHAQQVMAAGEPEVLEEWARLWDGRQEYRRIQRIPLRDADGRVTALMNVTDDLTERKAWEDALQAAHKRLEDAIESLPGAFLLYDADEGLVLWNSKVADVLPAMWEELQVGRSFAELAWAKGAKVLGLCGQRLEAWVAERLAAFRSPPNDQEQKLADGRWLHLLERRTTDGGTVCLRFDITERKEHEQTMRQVQKMEALGQLTGGVAHDFNNLLQIITGNASLLLRRPRDTELREELLEGIQQAGERAGTLTQRLLSFSRKQVLRRQSLSLYEVAGGMAKMLRRVLPESIALEIGGDEAPARIEADRSMVEQVLLNLAINARDAMPDGGRLTVSTTAVHLSEADWAVQDQARPGDYAVLRVSDTGSGMGPEVLEHIFEPFFTTKDAGHGTGLGLATVYGIVQQHEGLIQVASRQGEGTTFTVHFPLHEVPGQTETGAADAEPDGGTETVLVVEDDPNVRELVARILASAGYRLLLAEDGQHALDLLRRQAFPVHMALLDLVMPRMGGVECYRRLRERLGDIRALFASGWSQPEDERWLQAHGVPLLRKPFQPEELLRAVRGVLDAAPPDALGSERAAVVAGAAGGA